MLFKKRREAKANGKDKSQLRLRMDGSIIRPGTGDDDSDLSTDDEDPVYSTVRTDVTSQPPNIGSISFAHPRKLWTTQLAPFSSVLPRLPGERTLKNSKTWFITSATPPTTTGSLRSGSASTVPS